MDKEEASRLVIGSRVTSASLSPRVGWKVTQIFNSVKDIDRSVLTLNVKDIGWPLLTLENVSSGLPKIKHITYKLLQLEEPH